MKTTSLNLNRYDFSRRIAIFAIALIIVCFACWNFYVAQSVAISIESHALDHGEPGAKASHGAENHPPPPAFYSVLPFATLLLSIAFLPLFHATEHWWEHNRNRLLVAGGLGTLTLLYYCFGYSQGVIDHTTHELSAAGIPAAATVFKNAILVEYIPFIALLFSLYVISGEISVQENFAGTPKLNAGIIAVGSLLASFIGTTGAAMLLIRPLLKANAKRNYVVHTVVFFIFAVCNTGGCLLPIGDPPLFLGYLRGVGFTWTLCL